MLHAIRADKARRTSCDGGIDYASSFENEYLASCGVARTSSGNESETGLDIGEHEAKLPTEVRVQKLLAHRREMYHWKNYSFKI